MDRKSSLVEERHGAYRCQWRKDRLSAMQGRRCHELLQTRSVGGHPRLAETFALAGQATDNSITCTNSYAHYPPHSHSGLTTHLIRRGSLTITYPKDPSPTKETFGVGERIDVPAGKVHEVWMGEEGELNSGHFLLLNARGLMLSCGGQDVSM